MLSPVWIPIGSMFSILQMVMQLLALSRITSYSNSFQPTTQRSINTWSMMLYFKPLVVMLRNSSIV
ncbi:MAG: hypothetical protein A4E52_01927 [Pelotomaculum sp. PtaB.Bin013]|nr:MAG: hypothetical protein A4E52_01927 [Pelotomaculum sp. PtaB.Bin013]